MNIINIAIWLSIEWQLYYIFGLGLYEEEIVQIHVKHARNTESVNIFQDTFDVLAEFQQE